MNLSKEQVSNLTLLADFMEGLDDPRFNMERFAHNCDTPACAFGWACTMPQFKKEGLALNDNRSWRQAGRLFGAPCEETAQIEHGPYRQLFHSDLSINIKTPQQWAAHCRAFLKENGYEVAKSDGFDKFMKKVREPVQFCPVNSNGEWV